MAAAFEVITRRGPWVEGLGRSYEIDTIAPGHPASVRQSSTEGAACADRNKRTAYSSFGAFVMMGSNLVRASFVNLANAYFIGE